MREALLASTSRSYDFTHCPTQFPTLLCLQFQDFSQQKCLRECSQRVDRRFTATKERLKTTSPRPESTSLLPLGFPPIWPDWVTCCLVSSLVLSSPASSWFPPGPGDWRVRHRVTPLLDSASLASTAPTQISDPLAFPGVWICLFVYFFCLVDGKMWGLGNFLVGVYYGEKVMRMGNN